MTEVAVVVKKLLSGRAPGVDEIFPEMPKAVDTGTVWADTPLQCHMEVWHST